MTVVMKCVGLAGVEHGSPGDSPVGHLLAKYDPDAVDGLGSAEWTTDPAKAMTWPSAVEALDCWRQVSMVRPIRVDGQPNRPLTAYTIEVEPAP